MARELTAARPGRVDAVLAEACPGVSRAALQRLIAAGCVSVNGEPVRKSGQVQEGDRILVEEPPAVLLPATPGFDLPVLYEDGSLVAVDKPAGLAVHGGPGEAGPTVAGWFAGTYPAEAQSFGTERPGIVHRLDKDTTGVLLLAKTAAASAALSAAFEARETDKTYLAICDGEPRQARAVIEAPIARHPGDRTRMAVVKRGRAARTGYEVLAAGRGRSLLLVHPETGRTHQIRVHLAAIGCPVRFDRVYGTRGEGRQQLHAWRIAVPHPDGGRLTVTAPLPEDMRAEAEHLGFAEAAIPYTERCPADYTC